MRKEGIKFGTYYSFLEWHNPLFEKSIPDYAEKVMIPQDNAKDLADIPDNVKNGMEIIPVSTVDEVLKNALVRMPEPIEWDEAAYVAQQAAERLRGAATEPQVAH